MNAGCAPGKTIARGSANCSVREQDLKLVEHHVPVLAPGMPVLNDALGGQIQHPTQRVIVGKGWLVFRDLPELTVSLSILSRLMTGDSIF